MLNINIFLMEILSRCVDTRYQQLQSPVWHLLIFLLVSIFSLRLPCAFPPTSVNRWRPIFQWPIAPPPLTFAISSSFFRPPFEWNWHGGNSLQPFPPAFLGQCPVRHGEFSQYFKAIPQSSTIIKESFLKMPTDDDLLFGITDCQRCAWRASGGQM